MAFKMKPFSGFGNSPMKNKKRSGISGLSSSEKAKFFKESKSRAKEAFKRDAAKSGHGRMVDGKIVKASKNVGKNIAKQGLKRLGLLGVATTAYDIGKKAKQAIKGLKKRAKSGNVNIGRKI